MDLREALEEINAIRSDVARGTEFRGYGPATVALTGALAIAAAAIQATWVGDAAKPYLTLWVGTAAVSAVAVAIETIVRSSRVHAGLAGEMLQWAVEQFAPAAVAGALLTFVLFSYAPGELWLMPGLWQIVFSLGVFASCRFLPPAMFAVGVWYLVTGLLCIAFAQGEYALSPWAMGIPFGAGQLLMALVLYLAGRRRA